jgi:hydrophobic/amphiphilic exporter-1 (mainly G- bacteria), HAE1 family
MNISDFSLRRPVATCVGLIVLALFGYLALRNVGYDMLPTMSVPYVTVTVVYPGASPEEIETSVAKKLEDAATQVNGLKHVTATCANNFCQLLLEFEGGRDVDVMATDVREKIDLVKNELPSAAEQPKVLKYDMNATPVVTMALSGDADVGELYDYADDKLKARFSVLSGVAQVDLIGGERREVVVEIDRAKLASKGLTVAEVVQKVGKGNLKIPSGDIDDAGRTIPVTFDAQAATPQAMGDIELGSPRGAKVYLRDVATFGFGSKKTESLGFYDGKPAVLLKVTKRGEANALATVKRIREAFDAAAKTLPAGMKLDWVRDDGDFVKASVGDGFDSIWQSILLTGFILVLFLADWRTAFTAFVSIPVTVVITMVAFQVFGYTFNLITMSAIGITTGILVANSIVVLENIAKRLGERTGALPERTGALPPPNPGQGDVKSLVAKAAGEIALAVAASALTNVVVFLPIGTMKTMVGRILSPFAIVITAATFASLLVSFTLTPILAAMLDGRGEWLNRILAFVLAPWNLCYRAIEKSYNVSLGWFLKFPWVSVIVISAATILAFRLVAPSVKMDFIPTFDKAELSVRLEFPPDFSLAQTSERANALAAKVEEIKDAAGEPLVLRTAVAAGKTQGIAGQVSQGAYLAEITVVLRSVVDRAESIFNLAEKIRAICRDEPDVIWAVLVPNPVGGAGQQIALRVRGDDFADIDRAALATARELQASPVCADLAHAVRPGKPELRVYPNRAVLNDVGYSPDALGLTLRASFAGLTPATFTRGDRSYDVRVRLKGEEGVDQVAALNFPSPDGVPFALGALATEETRLQRVQIVRSDKRRAVTVYGNAAPGCGLGAAIDTMESTAKKHISPGDDVTIGGIAELMGETVAEFSSVTVIAIALTYLLLAAVLESWVQPFIILFTIPFSYLGMFWAMQLTGTTLTIFGLLAGIMLVGVVVNAAILMMDERTVLLKSGVPNREAVKRAAASRFRPILMSCMAALFGMLPMAFAGGFGAELRQSIGIGSVGGILVSSFVSLYFIPCLCALKKGK